MLTAGIYTPFSGVFILLWGGIFMDKKEKIAEALRERAKGGKITCSEARKIAEELGVSPREVGSMCDELKIKIWACELGCF